MSNPIFKYSSYVEARQRIMDSFQLQCTQHGLVTVTLHITLLLNNRVMWKSNDHLGHSISVLNLMCICSYDSEEKTLWRTRTMTSQRRRDNGDGPVDLTTHFPHFFKIIMPQTLAEGKLRIPKKFISESGVDLANLAFLMIPNGTKWTVKLTKCDGEVCFQNGWFEFASCYALTMGHLLVFRYEGNSQFSVLIFNATTTKVD
ncbi:b3 domain-containing transcription factor vrn1 [Quercus suber]|uniref:B3 domain-containing transcription factor vrn1 n=1 Tax=Quercus suber TaxID=58331 RepID=A0AAW0LYW5_QUESU